MALDWIDKILAKKLAFPGIKNNDETPALNHCRICGGKLNKLKSNIIKIKQDCGVKKINRYARIRGLT